MKRFNEYANCETFEEICNIFRNNKKERKLHRELMVAIWDSPMDFEESREECSKCYTYVRNMKRFRTVPELFFAWMFDGALDAIEYREWA